jgi:hypothetical protein
MGADYSGQFGLPIDPAVASTLSIDEINRLTTQQANAAMLREQAAANLLAEQEAAAAIAAEEDRLRQYEANQAALVAYNNAQNENGFWTDLAESYVSTVDTILDYGSDAPAAIVDTAFEAGSGIGAELEDVGTSFIESSATPISALADPVSAVADPLFENIEKIAIPLAVVGGAYLLLKT